MTMSYLIEDISKATEDIPSSQMDWPGASDDQLEFMRKVYDVNHKWSSANGTFVADIPEGELGIVEGKQLKKDAAAACTDLLNAARKDIKTAGVKVTAGLSSAYRSASKQASLWQSYFPDYYHETAAYREGLPGGAHGEKAIAYLARYIRPKVAIPGYSNHQNGIAVDLLNVEDGKKVLNRTKSPYPDKWRESWLWDWLTIHANNYGFFQNTHINEPWHWEYKQKVPLSHETYLDDFENIKTDGAAPRLIYRDTSPALETLYVAIDLGLGRERIFKKSDPRNDTALVEKMTGIFIPKNFSADASIDLLIYLHGHKIEPFGKDKSINEYWESKRFPHFAFRELLNDSGKNIVLVAPTLGPRSQARNLITNAGFSDFIEDVIRSIVAYCPLFATRETPAVNRIIVACHSGSGYNMYQIARLAGTNAYADKIEECWGFDCTYGPDDADVLHQWASTSNGSSPKKLYIYYRKGSGTEAQAAALKNRAAGLTNVIVNGLDNSADHNLIPGKYFKARLAALDKSMGKLSEGYERETATSVIRNYESDNPVQHNSVLSAAYDLFYRGFLSFEVLTSIINGERNEDKLTDMIFQNRHPESGSANPLIRASERDSRRLRTEWLEIKSRIIAPIFRNGNDTGVHQDIYGEASKIQGPPKSKVVVATGKDNPGGRKKWFNESRFGIEKTPSRELLVAYADARQQLRESMFEEKQEYLEEAFFDTEMAQKIGKNNWVPLGPSVIENGQASGNPTVSGRITTIEVGPGGQRIYVGAANGGVWRSLDEGKTWKPLDDFSNSPDYITNIQSDSLSTGTVAVKFGKSVNGSEDIIYVGTGDPDGGYLDIFGIGIKHSKKGGSPGSWTLEAANVLDGKGVYKIVIDPDDSSKVFAATNIGIFTRDVKARWSKIVSPSFAHPNDPVTDFIIAGSGSTKAYYVSLFSSGIYRSTDLGKTWTSISGFSSSANKVLAAGESDPNIIYVLDGGTNLARLDASVTPLRFETVNLNSFPAIGQGNYDLILAVDPSNSNTIYIAGDWVKDSGAYTLSLFKGTISSTSGAFKFSFSFNAANAGDAAKDPTFVGTGIHPDGHAIAFALDASGKKRDGTRVWIGCDGGLFYSKSSGTKGSFRSMNDGLAITQMTYLSQSPDIPTVILAGSQDNGVLNRLGDRKWYEIRQGDGGGVAIDPSNPLNLMAQYVHSSLIMSTDGGKTWFSYTPLHDPESAESKRSRFYSPIIAHPGATKTMWLYGSHRLWLTENHGATWLTLPSLNDPYATVTPDLVTDRLSGPITNIKAVSKDLIYATTADKAYKFTLSGGTWTNTPNTPVIKDWNGNVVTAADYFINAIDSEGSSVSNFYIALGGPGKFSRCYYYDGTNWHPTLTKKNKLDIPCSAIVVDPDHTNTVYLGSDVGVWKGVKAAGKNSWTWEQFSFGITESVILDLKIHQKARLLRAATHGRGVYEIALDRTSSPAVDLYLRMNDADNGRMDPRTKKRFDWNVLGKGVPDPYDPGKYLADPFRSPDVDAGPFFPATNSVVRVIVHNRGWKSIKPKQVKVYMLMAVVPIIGTLPPLPKDFHVNINKGDDKKLLAGSEWKFADPLHPFTNLLLDLEAYSEQSAYFAPDFSQLDFSAVLGLHNACFAAFVVSTDGSNTITGTNTDLDQLVLSDNHVAYRKALIP